MSGTRAPKHSRPKPERPIASEILPGVFVGGWDDATSFHGQRVCVLDELPDEAAPADEHVPIYDAGAGGPIRPNLERIVRIVDEARGRNEPVLLFCGHGVRRSPLAGAWYLHRHDRIPLDAAYDRLREVRPGIEHVRKWAKHWDVLTEGKGASS
jgi:protein-tyrosine phosphatase